MATAISKSGYNKWLLLAMGIIALVVIVTMVTIALLPGKAGFIINNDETCINRCGAHSDSTKKCQCNTDCKTNLDCCIDYTIICKDNKTDFSNITDQEIADLSQQIWDADADKLTVSLNLQGQIASNSKSDMASAPLFNEIPPEVSSSPIYVKLTALFDNYIRDDSVAENITESEWSEVDDFLTEAMKSPALQLTHNFLASKGVVSSDAAEFQASLKDIWYALYVRSGALSSSGAEHVQVGETKGDAICSGLHDWVQFALLEQAGSVNYLGYVKILDFGGTYLISNSFFWDQYYKPLGGFFIGTGPVFDLSVYTLCFYARPNSEDCTLNISGNEIKVQTYTMDYNGTTRVASSFPVY